MIYKDFQGLKLSQLGFGTMRLPLREDKSIDAEQAAAMTSEAIAKGVNYFDTAWPYHSGKSELVIGEILKQYPRESFYLADKFPGHQIAPSYDVKGVFERQLKKCGVEYFDFYLLHNVYENSIAVYEDERWNILPYLLEQKKNGRIRHLGFSTHAGVPALEAFLEKHANEMEFCQIELNYLDWTLQQAKEKCELLNRYGIPIWVMEPVRVLQYLHPEGMDMEWQLRLQFCYFQFWARFPILRSQRGSKGVKHEKQENIDKKSHFLHMSAGIDYSFGHANTVGYVTFIKDK